MRFFQKPLLFIGLILSGTGFFIWLILTIYNSFHDYNHLSVALPTGMALLGIAAILLHYAKPDFFSRR